LPSVLRLSPPPCNRSRGTGLNRWTLPCDLVSRGFHRLSLLSTATKVFQHASSLNPFHPGLSSWTSQICAAPKGITDETASSTFALTDSRRSTQSVDDRLFRNPPWLAPLRSSDRGLLCQTSSLLLPAATAYAPATFGLSASPVWPSLHLAMNRLESHLSTTSALQCRCCFQRLFRITPSLASGRSVTQCPFAKA